MILSTVKEEKLAALLGRWLIFEIEIWITNKIEPDAVSWSNFFRVGVMRHNVSVQFWTFLIDEEKKVAVAFSE